MGAELYVATRRPLPPHDGQWNMVLCGPDGGLEVWEDGQPETEEFLRLLVPDLSFEPANILRIRKAWDVAYVVAEVIATALGGIVTNDVDGSLSFDGPVGDPVDTISDLESRVSQAFRDPEPLLAEINRRESKAHEADEEADDWSDVV